jgi:AraC family transcriptional regulator
MRLADTSRNDIAAADAIRPAVEVSRPDVVRRRAMAWNGMAAESVQCTSRERLEYRFRAPVHLLLAYEEGERNDGETLVEGLPRSRLKNLAHKLIFVPAGHEYREWIEPRTRIRRLHFYFDPATLERHAQLDIAGMSLAPRLFFDDATLWNTAVKLKSLVESPASEDRLYFEALGVVLVVELLRLSCGAPEVQRVQARGGLAAWQERMLAEHIEQHLAERIPLGTLARLAGLSPSHFCRAFKQSFGMPPHRYQTERRMERAKQLLAAPASSVTDIGLTMGFRDTSAFSTAFRKATGFTPTGYQRNLG